MSKEEDLYNDGNDHMLDDEHDENSERDENDHSDMEVDNNENEQRSQDMNDNDSDNDDEGEEVDEEVDEEGEGEDEDEDDGEEGDEGEEGDDVDDGDDAENDDDDDDDDEEEEEEDTEANGGERTQKRTSSLASEGSSLSNSRKSDPLRGHIESSKFDSKKKEVGVDAPLGSASNDTALDSSNKTATKLKGLEVRAKALEAVRGASEFDIVPMVAVPYAQQCHSVAISEGPKWLLTGGEDGFIRKYDFAASIDGKAPLTVAQKHNLMDNINKAGVIGSYWENEQPLTKSQIINENPKFRESDFTTGFASYEPKINPVYSLDVEKNGLWCLSGLLSGGISLYTMIYNEGSIHHYFGHDSKKTSNPSLDSGHSDAVSVLRLNHAQNLFLSGSWDKTIREWDLNTGKTKNIYKGSTGQISSIRYRPVGLTDLTFDDGEGKSDIDSLFGSDQEDEENGDTSDANISKSSIRADSSKNKTVTDDKVFMSSSIDGAINIWDARISGSSPVLKLGVPENTPPWCMTASWSNDGDKIYAGRRNSTVDEFSLRMPHEKKSGNVVVPNVSRRLTFPKISGPVSSLSVMPNDNFIFCGSNDNIRLYNLKLYDEFTQETVTAKKRATPFYVIPGHHGGVLSNLLVDETGRFLISTSGNRGWGHSAYADVVLIYSIDTEASQQ